MKQMGDHKEKVLSFWGTLYDPESVEKDNERVDQNPPDGIKEELRLLFGRIYVPPGGPLISKSLVNVCPDNPVDLLPLFVSPSGDMTILCGISEPYEVLPVALPDLLPSGIIVALSESKPDYFGSELVTFHKLKVSGSNLDPSK